MGHDHKHGMDGERSGEKRLLIVLFITAGYMIVEVIGGLWFNSLALLADAGHMLSDVMAQGLAYAAIRIGRRSPTERLTYGFKRTEILAALWNGLALWAIVAVIFYEAWHRFFNPAPVVGKGMLIVAAVGLAVNLCMAGILMRDRHASLNVRGVFLHVISDALGSVGAIVAAIVILTTGLYIADPMVSVFIGVLILYSSWGLIRESVNVLMEGVPFGMDITEVERAMLARAGVCCIHDLHVWTISSRRIALSAHVVLADSETDRDGIVRDLRTVLRDEFNIGHITIQAETTHDIPQDESSVHCRPGTECRFNDRLRTE
ncbi:MAG: cation diffusion facilitator family transporter [Desulfomonilaceae bacterium]|nr:cation diffusion facilitator family transporter [Desulfomonilaceae bacterium]